jgi:hypothetical protein
MRRVGIGVALEILGLVVGAPGGPPGVVVEVGRWRGVWIDPRVLAEIEIHCAIQFLVVELLDLRVSHPVGAEEADEVRVEAQWGSHERRSDRQFNFLRGEVQVGNAEFAMSCRVNLRVGWLWDAQLRESLSDWPLGSASCGASA